MAGGGGSTVRNREAVPVPPAFEALMAMLLVPLELAVPLMKPVDVFTASPTGKPVALKLVGLLVAAIWYVKSTPCIAVAELVLVMTGGGGTTVRINEAVPVPPALEALMDTLLVPVDAAVPLMRPEVVLTARPAGKPVAL
jgi:hypothetical protein